MEFKNTKTTDSKPQNQKSMNEAAGLIKVGQIIKPDGSVTVFYKDKNGKIIKR